MVKNAVFLILIKLFLIQQTNAQMENIRYTALGDSYTIGEGAKPEEAWPSILVENLKTQGIQIELAANPSVTGWTSKDLIEKELPVFDSSNADFVTLLIGVNDWVQEVPANSFEQNLNHILDHVQNALSNPKMVVLITIPDFSVTPDGPKYSKGRDISEGLAEFNTLIQKAGKSRNLEVVDLFEVSKEMFGNPELIANDNLHPSAKTYVRWESVIRPTVLRLLK